MKALRGLLEKHKGHEGLWECVCVCLDVLNASFLCPRSCKFTNGYVSERLDV